MGAPAGNEGYSVLENASLRERNTFGVQARAGLLIEVREPAALAELSGSVRLRGEPLLVLGEGSNVLLTRDWPGVVSRWRPAAFFGPARAGFQEKGQPRRSGPPEGSFRCSLT